jgi:predicted RNase H-related nuclease YkuK (DUF458 family)
MARQEFIRTNISDFISYVISNANYSREKVEEEVVKYINTNPLFIRKVSGAIYRRLKIATGRLADGIKITAYAIQDRENSGKRDRKGKIIYQTTSNIAVYLTINDDRILALLSNPELKKDKRSKNIPEISELVDWIRGKSTYFNDSIKTIEDIRTKSIKRRRDAIINSKGASGRTSRGYDAVSKNLSDAPEETLAKIIQARMTKRVKNGLSATKGSEYVFLGIYSSTLGRNKKKNIFLTPKYRIAKGGQPLLTIGKTNAKGEINEIIEDEIRVQIDKVLKKVMKQFDKNVSLDKQLQSTYNMNQFSQIDRLNSASIIFQNTINSFRGGDTRKRREYAEQTNKLNNEASNLAYDTIILARKSAERDILAISNDLISTKKFRNIGRRAGRRRGR